MIVERYCVTHGGWSTIAHDASCQFLDGPLRRDGVCTMFILEGLQKRPSVNNIFSILYAILDGPKSQYQIVGATDLARQTVAETLVSMLGYDMVKITPEPYQGAVDDAKLVEMTEQGRKAFEGLEPWMDKMFPNWRRQIGKTRADRLGGFPVD
ncbi:MAG: hypothetical protein ACLP9K_08855 [Nitrososphaerales archaeon]